MDKHNRYRSMRRLAGAFCAAVAIMLGATSMAPAQADANAPAGSGAPAPGTTFTVPSADGGPGATVTVAAPEPTSMPALKSIADRVKLTKMDKTVLDATRDGSRQIDDSGLYVMLSVAARARNDLQLDRDQWDQLDRPAYLSLQADPGHYRARPMQMTLLISRMMKLKPGDGLSYNPSWPKDRTVWRLDGLEIVNGAPVETHPVIVFSVENPTEYLSKGKPGDAANETLYEKHQPLVRVAGLFYKDLVATDRDGKTRLYPIVMAWQLASGEDDYFAQSPGGSSISPMSILPVVILLAVLAAFYFVRKQATKSRTRGVQGPQYKPLRDEETEAGKKPEDPNSPDKYVDPDLAKAIEEFRHERGER